ncbi:hypothetical protein M3Y99_00182500 [Aphelenchoides fujianensis]|nr:hypothetical protein M3Y99_00182500 [Aphelenchoides fujianensis]
MIGAKSSMFSLLNAPLAGFVVSFLLFLLLSCSGEARSIYAQESALLQPAAPQWSFEESLAARPAAEQPTELLEAPHKRRVVIRVPFAQNPDSMQLSRIYKSIFSQKEKKENPAFDRVLRSWLQ